MSGDILTTDGYRPPRFGNERTRREGPAQSRRVRTEIDEEHYRLLVEMAGFLDEFEGWMENHGAAAYAPARFAALQVRVKRWRKLRSLTAEDRAGQLLGLLRMREKLGQG